MKMRARQVITASWWNSSRTTSGEAFRGASQIKLTTKAAYRFFSNPWIHEEQILRGHFQATGDQNYRCGALILMLHADTVGIFTFHRTDVAPVGS